MSARYECIDAGHVGVEAVPSGSVLGQDQVGPGRLALVLSYDEVVYIEGTKEQVLRLLARMTSAVERADENGPVPADYRDDA